MGISDAKKYVGHKCGVRWTDRLGKELEAVSIVHDVTFVPLYGGYLITDTEDIRLDKIVTVEVFDAIDAIQAPIAA